MPDHYGDAFKSSDGLNVVWNLLQPYTSEPTSAIGLVAFDTVVESIVRRILKTQQPMKDIAVAHAISIPFRGSPFVFSGAFGQDDDLTEQFQQGAMMAPSVLLGQYIYETGKVGLHVPKPALWNILSVLFSQMASQSLAHYTGKWFPTQIGERVRVLKAMFNEQKKTGITRE